MKNYTYVFTDTHVGSSIKKRYLSKIYDGIVLKYHYPVCQVNENLTKDEKNEILTDEYKLVKEMTHPDVYVHQFPRVLYDLFVILYVIVVRCGVPLPTYELDCDNILDYKDFLTRVKHSNQDLKWLFIEMNDFIVSSLSNMMIDGFVISLRALSEKRQQYTDLLKCLLDEIKKTYKSRGVHRIQMFLKNQTPTIECMKRYKKFLIENIEKVCQPHEIKGDIHISDAKHERELDIEYRFIFNCLVYYFRNKIVELCPQRFRFSKNLRNSTEEEYLKFVQAKQEFIDTEVEPVLYYLATAEKVIIEAIKYGIVFFDKTLSKNFFDYLNADLIETVLLSEISENDGSNNRLREKFFLYRGAEKTFPKTDSGNKFIDSTYGNEIEDVLQNYESPVDSLRPNTGYSISYNTSIFNGCLADYTACTYNFMNELSYSVMEQRRRKEDVFKNKYVLSKFFYGDKSIEDNLFFIPPLTPLAQLLSHGELWHVRSKVFHNSKYIDIQNFSGENCYNETYYHNLNKGKTSLDYPFPDFLKSSYGREKMIQTFKYFMKLRRLTILKDSQNGYNKHFTKTKQTSSKQRDKISSTTRKRRYVMRVLVLCQRKKTMREQGTRLPYEKQYDVKEQLEGYLRTTIRNKPYKIEYMRELEDEEVADGEEVDFNFNLRLTVDDVQRANSKGRKTNYDLKQYDVTDFIIYHPKYYDIIILNTCPFAFMDYSLIEHILKDDGVVKFQFFNHRDYRSEEEDEDEKKIKMKQHRDKFTRKIDVQLDRQHKDYPEQSLRRFFVRVEETLKDHSYKKRKTL